MYNATVNCFQIYVILMHFVQFHTLWNRSERKSRLQHIRSGDSSVCCFCSTQYIYLWFSHSLVMILPLFLSFAIQSAHLEHIYCLIFHVFFTHWFLILYILIYPTKYYVRNSCPSLSFILAQILNSWTTLPTSSSELRNSWTSYSIPVVLFCFLTSWTSLIKSRVNFLLHCSWVSFSDDIIQCHIQVVTREVATVNRHSSLFYIYLL